MKTHRVKVATVARPYTVTFYATGQRYPLTSAEAQRLIDEYPIVVATRGRVVLRGDGFGATTIIRPATVGGGDAFLVTPL